MMLNEVKQSIELRGRTRKENSVACIFQVPQVEGSRNFPLQILIAILNIIEKVSTYETKEVR